MLGALPLCSDIIIDSFPEMENCRHLEHIVIFACYEFVSIQFF